MWRILYTKKALKMQENAVKVDMSYRDDKVRIDELDRQITNHFKIAKTSEDYNVIAGQATCTKELVEDIPQLDAVIAPVSGGGVCSGACLAAHYKNKSIKVYAAEPELADDCYQSMKAGELRPHKGSKTIAEGLRVNISPTTFQIFQKHLEDVLLVS